MSSKLIFALFIFISPFTFVSAYNPVLNEVSVPYEVKTIGDLNTQTEHLGELKGDPHMYEFAVGEATELNISLLQIDSGTLVPFSLIVVKQNEDKGGVSEIGRFLGSKVEWQSVEDSVLGLNFSKSQVFTAELKPGIYRAEVSTPENYGKYALVVGKNSVREGYFATLADIYAFQKFFSDSAFYIIKSSYVYYPLGILAVFVAFYYTWRSRNRIKGLKNA